MWECRLCKRVHEDDDDQCWSCGGHRAHVEISPEKEKEAERVIGIEQGKEDIWECRVCRRLLEGTDTACWSCGGKRTDVEINRRSGEGILFKDKT